MANLDSVVQVPPIAQNGLMDYRWRRFFSAIADSIPPSGGGTVADGTATSYAPMVLYQGPDALKGGSPDTGDIYFALDTGRIYWASGQSWVLLSEELVGDVLKPPNSNTTSLANIFNDPGTYGSPSQTPVLSIDAKGRVIGLSLETVFAAPAPPSGANGALQFNNSGVVGGANIFFNLLTGGLSFLNPAPTREALSPLEVKGDIFVRDGSQSTRQPVGTPNSQLRADPSTPTGLVWAAPRQLDITFEWNVISVFPLTAVPANVLVKSITTYIEEVFDGTGAVLTIGDAQDAASIQENIDPYEEAGYSSTPLLRYSINTPVSLYINPGSATQGRGLISLELQER